MTSTRLVIIDTRVSDYQKIINGIKTETVSYVLLDYNTDTFETLLNKISELPLVNPLESVALVSHGVNAPVYKMIESMSPAQLYDVSSVDANLDSWSEFSNFFKCLCVPTIDLLGCAIYMNDNWKYVLSTLETQMEVNFRASVDNTGNLAVGGNWVLESDNVNIKDLYFNEGIEEWMGLLQSVSTSIRCIIDSLGNLYRLTDWAGTGFTLVNTTRKVAQVSTGYDHIAYIDVSNNLYTFGANINFFEEGRTGGVSPVSSYAIQGQLGYSGEKYLFDPSINPVNVANNRKIIQVACGDNHTLCLDTSGRVYSTGLNSSGQLGIGSSDTSRNIFTLVQSISNENTIQIAACANSSMAITSQGRLYVWGEGTTLGISGDTTNKLIPTRITRSVVANDISNRTIVSGSFGSRFYGFITSSGEVFVNIFNNSDISATNAPRNYTIAGSNNNARTIIANHNCYVITNDNNMYYTGTNISPTQYPKNTFNTDFYFPSFRLINNDLSNNPIKIKSIHTYSNTYMSVVHSYNSSHILDISGNLYGIGINYNSTRYATSLTQPYVTGSLISLGTNNIYNIIPMSKVINPTNKILAINNDQPFDYTYLSDISINSTSGSISWDDSLLPGTYEIIVDASSSLASTSTIFRLEVGVPRTSPTNFTYSPNPVDISYGKIGSLILNPDFDNGYNVDLSFIIQPPNLPVSYTNGYNLYLSLLDVSNYNIKLITFSISKPDLSASTNITINVTKTTPVLKKSSFNIPVSIVTSNLSYGQKLSNIDISYIDLSTNITYTNGFCNPNDNTFLSNSPFNDVSGTISFNTPNTIPSVSNSNITQYGWTFTPISTRNYNDVTGTSTVIVNKSDPSNVTLSFTDISYGRTLSQVGITQLFKNRFSPNDLLDVSGILAFDNSSTTIPNASYTTSYPLTFTPRDLSNYNVINFSSIVRVDKTDPSNVSFSYNKNLFYGQPIGILNEISGRYVNKLNSSLGTVTGILSFDNCGQILNTFDASRNSQPWRFTPTQINNYNIIFGNVDISINKSTPELSGTIVDTDISFGDNITTSIITATYRNPFTKVIIPGTRTWDLSGIPPVAFGANRDFSANSGPAPWTVATFRPSNLTDISNHNNASMGTLSVYVKATQPRNMTYDPNPISTSIATADSSDLPRFGGLFAANSYDTGGLPLTYKIREIRKVV